MYPMTYQMPRTDIGQVNSEQEAMNAYVAAGTSRIMFTADDRSVFVKSVTLNGQTIMDVFDKRPSEPILPASDFVTKKDLADALEALKQGKEAEE
jgi:hypothetical protein